MFYVYFDNSGRKLLSRSINKIARFLKITPAKVRTMLKSDIYINNGVFLLSFEDWEGKNPVRNPKGNPIYKKLSEIKGTIQSKEEVYSD